MDDDLITLLDDEDEPAATPVVEKPWRILIVDDDDEVHQATRFALSDNRILGRSLQLDSVYSAEQAVEFLQQQRDIGVILLDVVMESEDAGLRLVGTIRDDLALEEPRIILRTGQPGYAPEVEVITRYDINDYRTKSELTHSRLLTSLIAALRSYQQVNRLNTNQRGLQHIIEATDELLRHEEFERFADSVISHLAAILELPEPEGLILLLDKADAEAEAPHVVAASGRYDACRTQAVQNGLDQVEAKLVKQAISERRDVFHDHGLAMFCAGKRHDLCILVPTSGPVAPEQQHLLRVFGQHLSVSIDNISMIAHLHRIAYQDQPTGLPNRQALLEELQRRLQSPAGQLLALIDIDHFNSVNESIGYDAAEALLQHFARFLVTTLGNNADLIARIGPDVFAILSTVDQLPLSLAEQLTLADLSLGNDLNVKITATGSWVPLDAADFSRERLLSAAYAMLKEAKTLSTGHVLPYRAGLIDEVHENAILLQEMSHALAKGEFRMAYQPKWDLKQQRFHGMEALIRWQKPDGSWVSPAQFIPIAESSGLIVKLGQWVLRTACREYAELLKANPDPGPVAVNISGAQFRDETFVDLIRSCLRENGMSADQLVLEITETAAINDGVDEAIARLQNIRDTGIHIALDDFGTGYSSLSYLRQLPVDQLKIDRAFVQKLNEPEGRAIIETMVQLSHALHLSVVAEGAEALGEVSELSALGCDVLQGYVYARPMAMSELIAWQASPASFLRNTG